ncbi:Snf7-domain-containing protein [Lentinula lateritia]|uniref:Snf7-domain-containing protein n=1 Tax=Lentinula aff. lateritia TaxID=2804960 RepID=A0ACC1U2E8_9AGAR|nr:Snf7-domain-containing protein [Lentinula aff. lateritia]KAJ3853166.1 Snf7-domain-containing protein [Lentinula lateritia]
MSFMSWFGTRRDPRQSARDAIIGLRQQLQMIDRKEDYLLKKIEEEVKKAKANAVTNKAVATAALRRKKASEAELDKLHGTRLQLEMQVNTLESANMNAETMAAMKKAADALKVIHGNMTVDQVDATMNEVNAQREVAQEISEIISSPSALGDVDEDELLQELNDLEQEQLDERLRGADHVPLHRPHIAEEPEAIDEEEELRQLRASMAM